MIKKTIAWALAVAVVWMGVVSAGALVVQLRVPVHLINEVRVTMISTDRVIAEGTWLPGPREEDDVLSSTEIQCDRLSSVCSSLTARIVDGRSLGARYLRLERTDYAVIEWGSASVTYGSRFPCGTEIYTINFATNSGNGQMRRDASASGCDVFPRDRRFSLSSGVALTQEATEEAMPGFMKAALFFVRAHP